MSSINRFVGLVAGLVLLLDIAPGWGQPVCAAPGCNPTVSDGNSNTAGGTNALSIADEEGSGGAHNTAFGQVTLFNNTGSNNTAIGSAAMFGNINGDFNTAVGKDALGSGETGTHNTAIGYGTIYWNGAGNGNTVAGSQAAFFTDANLNTAIGYQTLQLNETGNNNTAIGAQALQQSTGTKNLGVGFRAGIALTTGNNNIYLGNQGVSSSEFQTMRLGSTQTRTFIAGINVPVPGPLLAVDTGTGQVGIATLDITAVPSSASYKRDIETLGARSAEVFRLRPVTFAYKSDAAGVTHYGLIAEEVAAVYPELVTRTAAGDAQAVKYHEIIPLLLNELQRQQQELAEVAVLRKELAELRALVAGQLAGQRTIASGPLLTQSETDEAMR